EKLTTIDTPTLSGGLPTGQEAVTTANLQMLSRDYLDNVDRPLNRDVYFSFASMTYSKTPPTGTLNTNYYRTAYAYDNGGRLNHIVDGTGTITKKVFDGQCRLLSTWIGTTDANLLQTRSYTYDAGGVGDSTLTAM